MKKVTAASLLILLFIAAFAQERIAKGYVLDEHSRAPIEGALVNVYDTSIVNFTDKAGVFNIMIPKRRRHLLISHEDYLTKKIILGPGFQHKKTSILLESIDSEAIILKEKQVRDSTLLTYKNALSLSLVELFSVAIAVRYERYISKQQSIGIHSSFYVYGFKPNLGSEYDIYANYNGIKAVPFYRFYPIRKAEVGLFIEGKIPFGYFDFKEIEYRYSTSSNRKMSTAYTFWTWGFGISLGVMRPIPRAKHGFINISIGYQYFPMVEPPEHLYEDVGGGTTLTYTTETDWWYMPGPGSVFDLKLTIGGIF